MEDNTILIKNALILDSKNDFDGKNSLLIINDEIAEIASEIDETKADTLDSLIPILICQ